MYSSANIGTPTDENKAEKWLTKAAEKAHPQAQFYLRCLYRDSPLFEKESHKALYRLRLAAFNNNGDAQHSLAECYKTGFGLQQPDHSGAVFWYKKAAEKGHIDAIFNLGIANEHGYGVKQNQEEAVLFYTIAADQGHPGAQYNLAVCYHYGRGVAADMQEALKYYRLAAEGGDTAAIFNLAVCCTDGIGMAKDTAEGIRLYTIAAKQGYVKAQVNLASCYERGIGVPIDIVKAKFWYRQAADQGDTFALQALSQLVD